jgi:endonuclease/exonuclease/phosphatase family metal-dependent hydrolase
MKILLGDFNSKVGWEDIFQPTTGNKSLDEISNDNRVRVVNFAMSKKLSKTQCSDILTFINLLDHLLIERHNQIDYILIGMRQHSSVLDAQSFRGADCDTDHYLVVAKIRERLAVSKKTMHKFHMERFNLKKLNQVEDK